VVLIFNLDTEIEPQMVLSVGLEGGGSACSAAVTVKAWALKAMFLIWSNVSTVVRVRDRGDFRTYQRSFAMPLKVFPV